MAETSATMGTTIKAECEVHILTPEEVARLEKRLAEEQEKEKKQKEADSDVE